LALSRQKHRKTERPWHLTDRKEDLNINLRAGSNIVFSTESGDEHGFSITTTYIP